MKTFKASKLKTHTAEVFAAAREDGAIIQQLRTNKEVIEEFVIISKGKLEDMECDYNTDRFVGLSDLLRGEEDE